MGNERRANMGKKGDKTASPRRSPRLGFAPPQTFDTVNTVELRDEAFVLETADKKKEKKSKKAKKEKKEPEAEEEQEEEAKPEKKKKSKKAKRDAEDDETEKSAKKHKKDNSSGITKDFYEEHPDVAAMSTADVVAFR